MTTSEKVAYLKGLAEGMGIQEDGGQESCSMSLSTFWKIFLSISRTRRTRWSI